MLAVTQLPELYLQILSFSDVEDVVSMSRVCNRFHTLTQTYTSSIIQLIQKRDKLVDYTICSFDDLYYIINILTPRIARVEYEYKFPVRRLEFTLPRIIDNDDDSSSSYEECPLITALREDKSVFEYLEANHLCEQCVSIESLFEQSSAENIPPLLAKYQPYSVFIIKIARNCIIRHKSKKLDVLLKYLTPRRKWDYFMLLTLLFKCAEADSYECYRVVNKYCTLTLTSVASIYSGICLNYHHHEKRCDHSLYNLGLYAEVTHPNLWKRFIFQCTNNYLCVMKDVCDETYGY